MRDYKGHRLSIKKLAGVFIDTGRSTVDLILIVAAAGFVIGILNITGLGFALTLMLVNAVGSQLVLLLIISAVICTILGMGMPTSGVYVLLAALVAPSLVEAGVQPIAAHLFILYFGMMSMITPPVALAAFAAATITKAAPLRTGLAAMRTGWAAYIIPFIFVGSPALILDASWTQIITATCLCVVGILGICASIIGYWHCRLRSLVRLVLGMLGFAALPFGYEPMLWGTQHGVCALAILCVYYWLRWRYPIQTD